jgi:hypothetical protein
MAREKGGWHALLQPWNRAGKRVFDDSGRFGGLETHLLGQPATTSREQQGTVQQDPVDSEAFRAEVEK